MPAAIRFTQGPLKGRTFSSCANRSLVDRCALRELEGERGGAGAEGEDDSGWKEVFDYLADAQQKIRKEGGGLGGEGSGGCGRRDRGTGKTFADFLHKKETDGCPKSFRPSKSTLDSDEYPSFDPSKLGRFKSAQLGQLAFTFFNFMFPMAVVALLVKEVIHCTHYVEQQLQKRSERAYGEISRIFLLGERGTRHYPPPRPHLFFP